MTTILELNDADLTLYRDGQPVYRAPGIAVIADREILFGDRALRLSRIFPRQANQQYFSRMSGDPLSHTAPRARNHADLVYLHLLEIAGLIEEDIILAVPAIFSAEQLGVLLGILHETGIKVAGFVDSAVAVASVHSLPAQVWHLDVLLQRAVLTALTVDDHVSRHTIEEVNDCGLVRLLDGWINVIADRFIRETRFDPLHAAATEQQLFNQLFDLVWGGSDDNEFAFELVQGDQTRRVELGRPVLEEKSTQRFRQLAELVPRGARVLLTPRSANLPGLLQTLQGAGLDVTVLAAGALPLGCEENLGQILPGSDDLRLITRLPGRPAPLHSVSEPAPETAAVATAVQAASGRAAARPTHALQGHRALPLHHGELGFAVARHGHIALLLAADGLMLNGTAIFRDTALEVGDRITHHGRDYLVISVEA